jgi:predicted hotdog family 3-hydroxylacyl-ACP dehydratase
VAGNPVQSIEAFAGRPAAEFTRHSGNMLLLDRLLELGPEHALCVWAARAVTPGVSDADGIPSYLSMECMAQCVAVLAGARARLDGLAPPLGLLLGTRRFRAEVSHLTSGVNYQVLCRELIRDSQGLASFDCSMTDGENTVAACRLVVFELQAGEALSDGSR